MGYYIVLDFNIFGNHTKTYVRYLYIGHHSLL